MVLSHQKLNKEAIDHLRKVSTKLFSARVLLYSSVYVYLERNEKFISIKAPFQFFTEAELEKYSRFKNFYLPNEVIELDHVRQRGATIRNALAMTEKINIRSRDSAVDVALDPAPWEVGPIVLAECRMIWAESDLIRFEAISVLIDEICGTLEANVLAEKFDQDIAAAEQALWLANWAVWIGLHLGYVDLKFLKRLRSAIYVGSDLGSGERGLAAAATVMMSKCSGLSVTEENLKAVEHPLIRQMSLLLQNAEVKAEVAA